MVENNTRTKEKFSFIGEKAQSAPNCDFPRIVTIDLSQKDAIAIIRTATERSLIIASEAQDRTMAIDALIAGADAVTFLEIEPLEMLLVRKAIAKGYTIVDRRQFPTKHFLVFPRTKVEAKLSQWQKAIAGEILNYWRGMPLISSITPERWNLTDIVSQIKLKSGFSLDEELESIIESLSKKQIDNKQDLLVHIEVVLDKWYCNQTFFLEDKKPNCCLAVLKSNTHSLIEAILTELEQSYYSWINSGSYTLSQWLTSLIVKLRTSEVDVELESQISHSRIHSALNNYHKLKQSNLTGENFTSALEFLKIQYLEKIKARSMLLAGEIFTRSILALFIYQEQVAKSDLFLYQLQERLLNEDTLDLLDLARIEKFQLSQYRDRLMMKLGKPFMDWSDLSETKKEILRTEVLNKSQRLAWELIIEQH